MLTGESLEPDYADFLHVEDDDSDHSKVSMVLVLYPAGTTGTRYPVYCRGTGVVDKNQGRQNIDPKKRKKYTSRIHEYSFWRSGGQEVIKRRGLDPDQEI